MTSSAFWWISTLVGMVLLLLVIVDIVLAVLHMDLPAPAEKALQQGIWFALRPLATWGNQPRRTWVAAAGPLMVVGTVVMWSGLFLGSFAFLVWPNLTTRFSVNPALEPVDFLDALYFSTVTVTTLGYGDIVPITAYAQVLAIAETILGFLMLAGVLTYLFTTLEGVFQRNALALRLHAATLRTGDGVNLVIRSLNYEEVVDLRERFDEIAAAMRDLEEHFHGYPILAFYYRNVDTAHDPEPMLRAAIEVVLAGRLLPDEGPARRLRPVVEDLEYVVTHFMGVIAGQYLGPRAARALEAPTPTEVDRQLVENIRDRLREDVPEVYRPGDAPPDRGTLELAFLARVFMQGLDEATGWKAFHPRTARRVDRGVARTPP